MNPDNLNFPLFYKSLTQEHIEHQQNSLVPLQFYSAKYDDFYQQIHHHVQNQQIKKFLLVGDGNYKRMFPRDLNTTVNENKPTNSRDIIEFFLEDLNLDFEYVNLSELCNVRPNEIHASEFYLEKLKDIVQQKDENYGFIALGSGTITDLLKHSLFLLNKNKAHFISIPTALTVTAFTSAFSVIDIAGAKRTRISKNIDATFWIEPLLKAAPLSFARAGFGDLLARFVAYGDWYLGSCLGMFDNYNEIALKLMDPFSLFLKCENINNSPGNKYLTDNTQLLAQTLAMAGVSMSLCGQTTPLSGYEHVISHGLDYLRLTSNKELVLHGEQVALSVLSSSISYDWLFSQDIFEEKKLRILNEKEAHSLIEKLLQKSPRAESTKIDISQTCGLFLKDYLEKNEKWNETRKNFSQFQAQWLNTKKRLQQLILPSNEIEKILEYVSLPTYPEATIPATTALEYRWALRFAPFVRSRFCLADFIFWIGEDPCLAAAM